MNLSLDHIKKDQWLLFQSVVSGYFDELQKDTCKDLRRTFKRFKHLNVNFYKGILGLLFLLFLFYLKINN